MLASKFEKQVQKTPHLLAVKTGTETLTYGQLNQAANRVALAIAAHRENKKHATEPVPLIVGLFMGHHLLMPSAVLGTLKNGAVYVPLSPDYPFKRLCYMASHSGVALIVSVSRHQEEATQLARHTGARLVLMDDLEDSTGEYRFTTVEVGADHPAYIMYTSGSTGTPKGVVQTHGNVDHFIRHWTHHFEVSAGDRLTLFSSFSHDASIMDIFAALLNGACLYPYDVRNRDHSIDISGMLQEEKITHWHSVPSLYNFFANTLEAGLDFPHLRYILLGGEAFRGHEILLLKQHFPHSTLVNIYGQTETSLNSLWKVRPADTVQHLLIGEPLEDTHLFVVDPEGDEVSPLEVGEILVASRHVSPGYWQEHELTQQVFSDDPQWGRLYWTGDLGRLLPDGNIEFMGRKDRQVKIRGFRVETGEIESCLLKLEHIKEAAVTTRKTEKGSPFLRAFITADSPPDVSLLRSHLESELPDYMIPTHFYFLTNMPLTGTGKIDRQHLDTLEIEPLKKAAPLMVPETEMEQLVAQTWKEVLAREQIGIDENLFDIGGNSFDMIQINNKLTRSLDRDIPIIKQFEFPTIRDFSHYLGNNGPDHVQPQPEIKLEKNQHMDPEIAVIGMAGRFPGAASIDEFWENLKNGLESISFFSHDELSHSGLDMDLLDDPNYIKAKGVLENSDNFDTQFFNFSHHEAEAMDPQLRVFHEVLWQAFENAGYTPHDHLAPIGLYAGSAPNHFWLAHSYIDSQQNPLGDVQRAILSNHFSTRAAYTMNLKGPVITMNTACSTSLSAIHLACLGLKKGDCHLAAAGGVSILLPVKAGYLYQEGMLFSQDGHVRAFDAQASGTIFSDGAGVVILKRLSDALADNDTIHAIVKGTAMANDGNHKAGYTTPGIDGQVMTIRAALASADVEPETIGFLETHGTGTALGDPVEIMALSKVFPSGPGESCAIGSVKNNIGHLNIAAGVTGFIKAVLTLKHRLIPPTINYQRPNPALKLEETPFYVNSSPVHWTTPEESPSSQSPRRAGVSSFGLGGVNAHAVLEEYIQEPRDTQCGPQIIPLSAATPTALQRLSSNLSEHLRQHPQVELADLAFTLQVGRKNNHHRRFLVCDSIQETQDILTAPDTGEFRHTTAADLNRPLVFLFPGQGSQYTGMARDLYRSLPEFQRHMDRCFDILSPLLEMDVKSFLYPAELLDEKEEKNNSGNPIDQTHFAQPLIFAVEYALAQQLMAWGVRPTAVMGHSIGQYAAACLAGVFSLEEALETVVVRGGLMNSMPPGAMLSVPLTQDQLEPMLKDGISLAAVNSPSRCVLSSDYDAILALKEHLDNSGHHSTLLHADHAYHSSSMEPVLAPMRQHFAQISLKPPQIPCISNLDGQWLSAEEAQSPAYWARHIRETVQFSPGIDTTVQQGEALFIEVGPGNSLSTFIRQQEKGYVAIDTMRHPREAVCDEGFLMNKIGHMWLQGVSIDWRLFNKDKSRRRIPLPVYPFEGRPYTTVDSKQIKEDIRSLYESERLSRNPDKSQWFYTPSWKRSNISPPQQDQSVSTAGNPHSLIFIGSSKLGTPLCNVLRKQGHRVTLVCAGNGFSQKTRHGLTVFTINPTRKEDYDTLFVALRKSGSIPARILHLWNLDGVKPAAYGLKDIQDEQLSGYHSLLSIAQAIGHNSITDDIRLHVFTGNMQEVTGGDLLYPGKATITGPVKVIPSEYPNIKCSSIDLEGRQLTGTKLETLLPQLLTEITAPITAPFIAYRNGYRWVQTFVPTPMEKPTQPMPLLRAGGVYLITGGQGGLGLVFARYLAETIKGKIILIGRSTFPAREEWSRYLAAPGSDPVVVEKIRQLQEFEQYGCQVHVFSADIVNRTQLESVIKNVHRNLGPINGVFHAAGLPDGEMIQLRSRAASQKILDPKVTGTWRLMEILRPLEVDFMVLFSSINAVTAPVGQVAYCSGNVFMDTFAQFMKGQATQYPARKLPYTVSINWPRWHNTGMALIPEKLHQNLTGEAVSGGLSHQDGLDAFNRAMSSGSPQVVVCDCDLELLQKHVNSAGVNHFIQQAEEDSSSAKITGDEAVSQRNVSTAYAPPETQIQHRLIAIYQEFFGNRKIGINDDFFELGGDSLKAISMTHRLKKEFPPVSLNEFLAFPTVRELATIIAQAGTPSNSTPNSHEENRLKNLACIEKLNRGQNKKNIFIIHPMHGMVSPYRLLAEALEERFNVYGIEARGVKPGTSVSETPDRMMEDYIEQILQLQEEGPFVLAGYCVGAFIAYEIVRRLEDRGMEVKRLIVFDETAFTIDRYDWFYRLLELLPNFGKSMLNHLNEWLFDRLTRKRNLKEIDDTHQEDIRNENFKLHMHALGNHVLPLGIIKTPILAFLADDPLPNTVVPNYKKMTKSDVFIVQTPGNHDSIFESPNVQHLAKSIIENSLRPPEAFSGKGVSPS
jgi:amino acid adenylation domain-containing protein